MDSHLYPRLVFALYQFSLLFGILCLPMALVFGRLGLSFPIHKVVLRLERASARASPNQ